MKLRGWKTARQHQPVREQASTKWRITGTKLAYGFAISCLRPDRDNPWSSILDRLLSLPLSHFVSRAPPGITESRSFNRHGIIISGQWPTPPPIQFRLFWAQLPPIGGEQMRVSLFINHDIVNRFYQSPSSLLRRFLETFIRIDIAKDRF